MDPGGNSGPQGPVVDITEAGIVIKMPPELPANQRAIKEHLREEWRHSKNFDVTIRCSDGDVHCHRIILGALSGFLREAMRAAATITDQDLVILTPDVQVDKLRSFLGNVYVGGESDVLIDQCLTHFYFEDSKLKSGPAAAAAAASEMIEEPEQSDRKRSLIWNFFKVVDKGRSRCQYCGKILITTKSSTSSMIRHLQNKHVEGYLKYLEQGDDLKGGKVNDFVKIEKKYLEIREPLFLDNYPTQDPAFFDDDGQIDSKIALVLPKESDFDFIPSTEPGLSEEPIENVRQQKSPAKKRKPRISVPMKSKAKKKKVVWKWFSALDEGSVRCKACRVQVPVKDGRLSGMYRHMKFLHPQTYRDLTELMESLHESDANEDEEEEEAAARTESSDFGNRNLREMGVLRDEPDNNGHTEEEQVEAENIVPTKVSDVKRDESSGNNPIWNYFMLQQGVSYCKTCSSEVTVNTTGPSSLVAHIKTHADEFQKYLQEVNEISSDPSRKIPHRPKKSAIWNFFGKIDKVNTKCLTCDKHMNTRHHTTSNLIRHLQSKHEEKFLDFMELSGHDRSSVTVKKQCPKKKRKKRTLKNDTLDLNSHTCPVCEKVHLSAKTLLYHMKVHHAGYLPQVPSAASDTPDPGQTFLCSVCGKTFLTKKLQMNHERAHHRTMHKSFQCSFCDKRFMDNQKRSRHERVHTGEKPFQCTDCGKQFAQQHQLQSHTRVHTGIKPYSCKYCNQMFKYLSSRNKHKCPRKKELAEKDS